MTIQAITFDFWQTLYKSRAVDYRERTRRLQADLEQAGGKRLTYDQVRTAVKKARNVWSHTWITEQRTLDAGEWLAIMIAELELLVDPVELQKLQAGMETSILEGPPILMEEVPAVLEKLTGQYRLAVISDTGLTPGRMLRHILEQDNIIQYFSHLTFSDELGHSKPHPQSFISALDALNAKPAEAVHIGDLLRTDIAGAQGVGMRGVQYVGAGQDDWSMSMGYSPETAVMPDAIIHNHTELLPLLTRWNNGSGPG